MTAQSRPNLGGLFDGSTPADRTSGIAGRLGPRLVTRRRPAGGQCDARFVHGRAGFGRRGIDRRPCSVTGE